MSRADDLVEPSVLLTTGQMAEADRLAVTAGTSGTLLMRRAGTAVVEAIRRHFPPSSVLVLCGPGNNGGDGFVVARLLADDGWPVTVALAGRRDALKGDAAFHAAAWTGEVVEPDRSCVDGVSLVVDALFGAGLSRGLSAGLAPMLDEIRERGLTVVAIDLPSGVGGDTGAVLPGDAAPLQAELTVTFFRKKPGHLLLPGRVLAGTLVVADIGIPDAVLAQIPVDTVENTPASWRGHFPWPALDSHKYARGHALVSGGMPMTGAARMAARAALRIGAGLVTLAAPHEAWAVYAMALESVIVVPVENPAAFDALLADERRNAVLVGPGAGAAEETRRRVLRVLEAGRSAVIDADGLTAFAGEPDTLARAIRAPCVLTPHAGEFSRLFGPVGDDKLAAARRAATQTGAVVLLKGADTVVAAPDGRAVINSNAPPFLATAGAGDVLAGLILGLLAQGMPAFEAAAAAAWIHGAAASAFGPGLIAEDLIDGVPAVLRRLAETR